MPKEEFLILSKMSINKRRLYSSLGYLPPDEFEEVLIDGKSNVPRQITLT